MAIIEAIADIEGVDPAELPTKRNFVLYDYVNTEALDRLVTTGSAIAISLVVGDYRVRIDGEELTVDRS